MVTIISFLVILGILVFVHEFGHFIAAKSAGVRVETFSVGMGPKLLKKRWGDTEYCLSAIPLGGYVKLKGENPDEVAIYFNKSNGITWQKQVISDKGSHLIQVADFGNDGDMDIMGANHGGEYQAVEIWENLSN